MKQKRSRSRRKKTQVSNHKGSVFKSVEATPSKFTETMCPINLEEQKQVFLESGVLPGFKLKGSDEAVEKYANKSRCQIRTDYIYEATSILEYVREQFGDGCHYMEENWGPRITSQQGTDFLCQYLKDNNVSGQVTVYWTRDLTCSARMIWRGPNQRFNKPEARQYTLVIKNAPDNSLLRETGIQCLADHEIGTHFFRTINDGIQPWYSGRKTFGLRSSHTRQSISTEEGLACINTSINSRVKLLWNAALVYYAACKALEMTFSELYDHLEQFVSDKHLRFKHVMRIKRSLRDPNELGGNAKDQCYFEGALEILQNIDAIDFTVLYSGRVCWDEVSRVKRLARTDCIRVPKFAQDMDKFRKKLKHIAHINGLDKSRRIRTLPLNLTACKSASKLHRRKGKHRELVTSSVDVEDMKEDDEGQEGEGMQSLPFIVRTAGNIVSEGQLKVEVQTKGYDDEATSAFQDMSISKLKCPVIHDAVGAPGSLSSPGSYHTPRLHHRQQITETTQDITGDICEQFVELL